MGRAESICKMSFSKVYPYYLAKAEKKGAPRQRWTKSSAG